MFSDKFSLLSKYLFNTFVLDVIYQISTKVFCPYLDDLQFYRGNNFFTLYYPINYVIDIKMSIKFWWKENFNISSFHYIIDNDIFMKLRKNKI